MKIGYLQVAGGIVLGGFGLYLPVAQMVALAGLWLVVGIVSAVTSQRTATVARSSTDLLTDPIARAKMLQGSRGAPLRAVASFVCAAAAIAVGIWGIDGVTTFDAWRLLPIILGAIIGFFTLLGSLMLLGSGVERSATTSATVMILGYKDTAIRSDQAPYVRFVLNVFPEGGTPYQATVQRAVPILAVPHLAVGASFPALAAGPAKPNNVIVDWLSPIAVPPPQLRER